MIAKLRGTVAKKLKNALILDTGPVGFQVFVAPKLIGGLNESDPLDLWTFQVVRENEVSLYGFLDFEELQVFELLLSVSGVGPKMAMGILRSATVSEVKKAVTDSNTATFTRVSGIGEKNAARIILELKGKLGQGPDLDLGALTDPSLSEVESALKNLGYSVKEIREALSGIDQSLSLEDKIKAALKNL